jgi:hypothetical protein
VVQAVATMSCYLLVILISTASLLRQGEILDRNLTQRFTQFGDKKCRPIASTG